jgi:ABC-2 type transport system permease protein
MKALAIAATGLRRLFRDRTSFFFLFVFPLLIIVLIGAAFGGEATAKLGVVADGSGPLGDELVAGLRRDEALDIREFGSEGDLREAVERGEIEAGVVIPAGYDAALRAGEQAQVKFVTRNGGLGESLQLSLQSAVAEQAELVRAARFAEGTAGIPFDEGLERARALQPMVPRVEATFSIAGGEEEERPLGRFDLGAAQQLLLFVFVTSLTASDHIILSRLLGVSRRMLATPTSVRTVVFGETLGRFGVAMVQGLFIVLASAFLFAVDWGDPLGAAALVVLFALVATGAGLLLGTVLQNQQQAASIGVFVGLGLAALGGCMVPLEVFPETMRRVAHLTPHAWALDGFAELIRRGGTLADILPELGVLVVYAAALLSVATWRFRRSIAG